MCMSKQCAWSVHVSRVTNVWPDCGHKCLADCGHKCLADWGRHTHLRGAHWRGRVDDYLEEVLLPMAELERARAAPFR